MIMICFDFVHTATGCATRRTNPLNTQYNSKLMHHSYAHSDWLENWAKFVYYYFFFFFRSFVLCIRSYYDVLCRWVTACLHAVFGNANLGGDWIVGFGLNQKIDQTENVVCAVPLPLPSPPSSWPLRPLATKHRMITIKWSAFGASLFISVFTHFPPKKNNRKSKLAAVPRLSRLEKNIFWIW